MLSWLSGDVDSPPIVKFHDAGNIVEISLSCISATAGYVFCYTLMSYSSIEQTKLLHVIAIHSCVACREVTLLHYSLSSKLWRNVVQNYFDRQSDTITLVFFSTFIRCVLTPATKFSHAAPRRFSTATTRPQFRITHSTHKHIKKRRKLLKQFNGYDKLPTSSGKVMAPL